MRLLRFLDKEKQTESLVLINNEHGIQTQNPALHHHLK